MPGKRFLRLVPALLPAVLAAALPASAAASGPIATPSSVRVVDASALETRTNGRIFGFYPGLGRYSCSGTALDTPSRSIVLTAGHCVRDQGIWGRDVVFVPAYEHGARPFGNFSAAASFVTPQWRKLQNPDFDLGAFEVKPNRLGALVDVVGGREWTTGRSRLSALEIFGYPAGALRGESLRSCPTRAIGADPMTNPLPGPPTMPARCDMASGSSGGAWILEGRYVDGVTSYTYQGRFGRLFSPYFGPAIGNFLSHLP
jgi:Trypsin